MPGYQKYNVQVKCALLTFVNNFDKINSSLNVSKRLGERQKQTTSAVWEHQSRASHAIDWEGVKILDQETVDIKRKIKEAIHIRRQNPKWR